VSRDVLRLAECAGEPASVVGGKALGLARLLRESCDVPAGFVVTAPAYREWLGGREPDAALFADAALGGALAERVRAACAELGEGPVAVRSSATAEDSADASFAGQQETYLGVRGADAVASHVVRCWGSLFTPHAISYRERLGLPASQVAMAVLVQRMVPAEAAGVMLTIDPVNGDRSRISIEAVVGLGPPLVGGELTPDRYAVDKVTLEIRSRAIAAQPFAERLDPETGGVARVELAAEAGRAPALTDDEVLLIAGAGKRIERTFGHAVDVEWALGPGPSGPRHLHLLQARPETVWSGRRPAAAPAAGATALDRMVTLMLGKRAPDSRSET
jgi:phosphoenolpyruvate synthase/pyruvate phosphate dikinase